ncbi:MAG: carbamoyltransferase HypF [Polyangiales bacterium]
MSLGAVLAAPEGLLRGALRRLGPRRRGERRARRRARASGRGEPARGRPRLPRGGARGDRRLRLAGGAWFEGTARRAWVCPWSTARDAARPAGRGRDHPARRGRRGLRAAREALDALAVRAVGDEARPRRRGSAAARGSRLGTSTVSVIAPSEREGAGALLPPPDLATCDECLADVDNPRGRHHRYAFTSCVACGPRFAVTRSMPYDRERTTLAGFTPCAECAREHADPSARRFHAQTLACPACGPRLWLADRRGDELPSDDALADAAARLREGQVLAVQGLGAFHLVCDATRAEVVATLRRRKRRDAQPFAVMVADLDAAERVAHLDADLREALCGPGRPIVLAPTRADAPLAARAVSGPSPRTGVMLPYSPTHRGLARAFGGAMVVTSGNLRGGPAAIERGEALRALGDVADAFVLHDRAIARRVEDSVVARAHRGVRVIRRARGLAPAPIRLPAASPEPVLALGGHQKSAACVVVGDQAYLTPHLGDLDSFEGEQSWRRELEGLEALLGVRAEALAHDLHPDYASTRYALRRPARRRLGVQHHVAHALAALAEHGLDEPAIAVAFDGTGFGTDGTAWGGEVLLVDGPRWTRLSALRPIPLPGGERAIREVWRAALGALVDAFGEGEARALSARLRVFDGVPAAARETALRMIAAGVESPGARGVGRAFDAAGALALALPRADYDAHVATALEACAEGAEGPYPFALPVELDPAGRFGSEREIDLRPTFRALTRELVDGRSPSAVSARFHASVVEATAAVVTRALAQTGLRRVVLCGGAMQNRRLEEGLIERLGADRVCMARAVPLNDGGLALGQAWAAVLALRGEGG